MSKNIKKRNVYIDALALAQPKMSGVGSLILETVRALSRNETFLETHTIVLVLPIGKRRKLVRHKLGTVTYRTIPIPARPMAVLLKWRLLPPLDLFIGGGIYVFPNYRNWPLVSSKSITYIHDLGFIKFPETLRRKNLDYLRKNVPLWIRRSDKVVSLLDYGREELIQEFDLPKEKAVVVNAGVDPRTFTAKTTQEIAEVKRRHGITAKNYIMYLGNIEPRKNLPRLIEAYEGLDTSTQVQYPLLIVGAGGWNNEELLTKLDSLAARGVLLRPEHFVPDEDLPALLSGAKALAFPSLYEGFGIPPVQAAFCGTFPLVSNIGPFREIFGKTLDSWTCDPASAESIRRQLEAFLSLPESDAQLQLSKVKERVKKYSWDDTIKELVKIIEGLEWKK